MARELGQPRNLAIAADDTLDSGRATPVRRPTSARALQRIAIYVVLILGALVVLFPLIWMLSSSLKQKSDIFTFPPSWIPSPILWSNYPRGLETMQFPMALRNTLLIAIPCVIGQVLSCSLVGYGLARFRFRGRDALFILVLATLMLPTQVTIIPTFIIFSKLGMVDSFWPFWLPAFTATSGFNIFLFRQFFLTISPEIEDAARIDGAGPFAIFWRIFLPLSKPVFAAVALFSFLFYWNDFFGPLIYLPSTQNKTLQLMLMSFQQFHTTDWGPMMAASLVIIIVPLVIFFFAQRTFIQGVVFTGIKE
ncbi:MAG: carbohydrate ABC transporter permease [Chloroflexi bacterium]|nr:carbohydrate ABC transporter permease [Chloroflexota bacterium]